MSVEIINSFFQNISGPAQEAINSYANWYFTQALFLVVGGAFAIYVSIFTKKIDARMENSEQELILCVKAVLAVIGFLFVSFNFPDIVAPDAIAIHRLISDIRG